MKGIPDSLNILIDEFSKFPGIGKKSAERLAIHVLKTPTDNINKFSLALNNVKSKIGIDEISHCFQEGNDCINDKINRDNNILCIVKDPTEVFLIEKSGYRGHYHVLDGLISPLDGITAEDLNIKNLLEIINKYKEVVIAIDPNAEGDATTLYLIELLKDFNIKITRLARGIPIGASFDYIDEVTLTHSLEDRIEIK